GQGLGLGDDAVLDDGRGARGLEADHLLKLLGEARAVVLAVAAAVGRDIAGVPHGDQVIVRRAPELVYHLEGPRLLAFETEGVEAVHQGDGVTLRDLGDDGQRLVEVAVDHEHGRSVYRRLRELADGHRALGHHDEGAYARARGIGRGGGGGVAGGGAD